MNQIILRITNASPDAEVLEYDNLTDMEHFSSISIDNLIEKLEEYSINRSLAKRNRNIDLFGAELIGKGNNSVIIKQAEHKRIVTYKNKAYNITFPNSIYIIDFQRDDITCITAYCYKDYAGSETELYKYAMPNMLTEDRICMGTAPKRIKKRNYVEALEKIIFTQYTHVYTNNIKSFKETEVYFEYLSNHEFPYELLLKINMKLKDVIEND